MNRRKLLLSAMSAVLLPKIVSSIPIEKKKPQLNKPQIFRDGDVVEIWCVGGGGAGGSGYDFNG
jgi:hypothetical protein